jgi:hypothetical protein
MVERRQGWQNPPLQVFSSIGSDMKRYGNLWIEIVRNRLAVETAAIQTKPAPQGLNFKG